MMTTTRLMERQMMPAAAGTAEVGVCVRRECILRGRGKDFVKNAQNTTK